MKQFSVKYTWGNGSYGMRFFEISKDASAQEIERAAHAVAPSGIKKILKIEQRET